VKDDVIASAIGLRPRPGSCRSFVRQDVRRTRRSARASPNCTVCGPVWRRIGRSSTGVLALAGGEARPGRLAALGGFGAALGRGCGAVLVGLVLA